MSLRLAFCDKKFAPLFWTQFLGALNDNFLKSSLIILITYKNISLFGLKSSALVAFSGGIFILPFFLFSTHAGQMADKMEKSRLVRITKIWELVLMVLASIGFYFNSYGILLFLLFLMGVQSTFFGPVKYSIIPELIDKDQLTAGNAYIELGTFMAILIGTITGGLAAGTAGALGWIMCGLMGVAAAGLYFSWKIPPVPIGQPDLQIRFNPFPTMISFGKIIAEKKAVLNAVLGISWFWFFGAGILSVLPVYCKEYLGAGDQVVTAFLTTFSLGIGLGSVACEKLSFKRVEMKLVPIGFPGMILFLIDLFFITPSWSRDHSALLTFREFMGYPEASRLVFDFFCMAIFGGLFIVPLYALIQERSPLESLSRVIAGNNILNALFMVLSSLMVMAFFEVPGTGW